MLFKEQGRAVLEKPVREASAVTLEYLHIAEDDRLEQLQRVV